MRRLQAHLSYNNCTLTADVSTVFVFIMSRIILKLSLLLMPSCQVQTQGRCAHGGRGLPGVHGHTDVKRLVDRINSQLGKGVRRACSYGGTGGSTYMGLLYRLMVWFLILSGRIMLYSFCAPLFFGRKNCGVIMYWRASTSADDAARGLWAINRQAIMGL